VGVIVQVPLDLKPCRVDPLADRSVCHRRHLAYQLGGQPKPWGRTHALVCHGQGVFELGRLSVPYLFSMKYNVI
jgi:hypothetical protein